MTTTTSERWLAEVRERQERQERVRKLRAELQACRDLGKTIRHKRRLELLAAKTEDQ